MDARGDIQVPEDERPADRGGLLLDPDRAALVRELLECPIQVGPLPVHRLHSTMRPDPPHQRARLRAPPVRADGGPHDFQDPHGPCFVRHRDHTDDPDSAAPQGEGEGAPAAEEGPGAQARGWDHNEAEGGGAPRQDAHPGDPEVARSPHDPLHHPDRAVPDAWPPELRCLDARRG